ncbi:MAG: flagellar biosynthetic protein FliR, partial [Candidatus Gastranaerophilaceae bacterium]
ATMFDASTKSQSSIIGTFFTLFGTVIFMDMGGTFWLLNAFKRSFEIFGIYGTSIPLTHLISLDYLILITSNILYMGLQIAAPVLLATLGQDIILGIISKTAPQVNVFQLSFLFKPVLGAAILVFILPMLLNVINDYFAYFSNIY